MPYSESQWYPLDYYLLNKVKFNGFVAQKSFNSVIFSLFSIKEPTIGKNHIFKHMEINMWL